MNGVHDMGGMHGMGPIVREEHEPVFHERWEGRVYALTRVLRLGSRWNIDMSRFSIERIPPARYLASSYYQRWLLGLERRLVESGTLTEEEIAEGRALQPKAAPPARPAVRVDDVPRLLTGKAAGVVDIELPARFKPGDAVRARNMHPRLHTRLPRYVRGRAGTVERDLGVHTFPDAWVERQDPDPQHVYSVRFEARELWGPQGGQRDAIYLDMWEAYLEPAQR